MLLSLAKAEFWKTLWTYPHCEKVGFPWNLKIAFGCRTAMQKFEHDMLAEWWVCNRLAHTYQTARKNLKYQFRMVPALEEIISCKQQVCTTKTFTQNCQWRLKSLYTHPVFPNCNYFVKLLSWYICMYTSGSYVCQVGMCISWELAYSPTPSMWAKECRVHIPEKW